MDWKTLGDFYRKVIIQGQIEHPPVLCDAPIKPNIVFYGEPMPKRYEEITKEVKKDGIDLCLIFGTSLADQPFESLADIGGDEVPKVLINVENTKKVGFDFDDMENHPERLWLQGKCDDVVKRIYNDAGWDRDIFDIKAENLARLKKEMKDEK